MATRNSDMQTTVESINNVNLADGDKISATVNFYKLTENFGYSAKVKVWIPKRDALISELSNDAISAAINFLKDVQSHHSS